MIQMINGHFIRMSGDKREKYQFWFSAGLLCRLEAILDFITSTESLWILNKPGHKAGPVTHQNRT